MIKTAFLHEFDTHGRIRLSHVPVFGFNSGKYDLNMVKYYFVKTISNLSDAKVAKTDNLYMFHITPWFKFLVARNYLAHGVSYDGWCKANRCEMRKLVFPYEWQDDYERLSKIGPVYYEAFYSKLKGNILLDEYNKFMQNFSEQGCKTMMDWVKVYSKANVIPFIEAIDKTR